MSLFSEIEKTIERGFRLWTEPADSDYEGSLDHVSANPAVIEVYLGR